MSLTLADRVRAANVRGPGERSVAVRLLVLSASLVAAHAVLDQGVGGLWLRVGVYVGIPAGHLFSHLTRERPGLRVKAAIAVAMLMAVARFVHAITQIAGDASAVQVPLAELFLWTLLLHSWDVPTRRDLSFSLVASLVLVGVAGTLSLSLGFALTLVAWLLPAFAAMLLMHRSELAELPLPGPTAETPPPPSARRAVLGGVGALALVVTLALVAFVLLPAAGGARAFTFPVHLPQLDRLNEPGALVNPTLGDDPTRVQGDPTTGGSTDGRTSFGYFGFAKQLDTGLRGRPDDTLVMRVRARSADFWRGQSFDRYDGRVWSSTLTRPLRQGGGMPIELPTFGAVAAQRTERFVQTYYVERPGPNIVFGAATPSQLYFGDDQVYLMPDGAMRSGVLLDKGTVYTVSSLRPLFKAEELDAVTGSPLAGMPEQQVQRYTQLPASLPQRVRDLARSLTTEVPSTYGKVRAIEAWLGASTKYTLDVPPLPKGADAVDRYLFEDKIGFCEQIGSALVVMLRSVGVPARLAVGYAAGQRNPLTGLFEVRASDAHAWAEVWIPTAGWVPFDPTASVPLAGDGGGTPRAADGMRTFLVGRLPTLPAWVVSGLQVAAAVMGAVTVASGTVWLLRRRRGARRRPWVERWVAELERVGARRGRRRAPTESARTYAAALGLLDDPTLARAVDTVEREAFGGGVDEADRAAADRALAALARR